MILLAKTFSEIFWGYAPIFVPTAFILFQIGLFILSELNVNGCLDHKSDNDIFKYIFFVLLPIVVFLVLFVWWSVSVHTFQNVT